MNLFIGNNFSKVAVIFRYFETTYQWCNYCHRDAHYIIYYKSIHIYIHISGITLHSIPNLFAKLIFPWWFRIKNPLEVLEQTFKIHSLNRKRINLLPPRFYQENEITILGYSATNRRKLIHIYTYTRNEGYFLPFISILPLTCVFIHFRQDHQREINYRRKKEPRG